MLRPSESGDLDANTFTEVANAGEAGGAGEETSNLEQEE